MKDRGFLSSLAHAFRGIRETSRRERNFRIQLLFAIGAVALCILFRVSAAQFALVALAIFFVLAAELFNTAIEAAVDLASGGRPHPLAKAAKDAAAGGVLLAAAFAAVVAIIVGAEVIGRYL